MTHTVLAGRRAGISISAEECMWQFWVGERIEALMPGNDLMTVNVQICLPQGQHFPMPPGLAPCFYRGIERPTLQSLPLDTTVTVTHFSCRTRQIVLTRTENWTHPWTMEGRRQSNSQEGEFAALWKSVAATFGIKPPPGRV